jgi:hypothetical protein
VGLETGRETPTGGATAAVTDAHTPPEGRSHAEGQHLELMKTETERGGAGTSSRVPVRWMS